MSRAEDNEFALPIYLLNYNLSKAKHLLSLAISILGLRRNSPLTIVLSKFSSASSLNMLPAQLYEQVADHIVLADRILPH